MDIPIREMMTGGLSDYDKKEEVEALLPLINLLVTKLGEINVPATLVVEARLQRESSGLGMNIQSFVLGRNEDGHVKTPGLTQAISILSNDQTGNIIFNVLAYKKLEEVRGGSFARSFINNLNKVMFEREFAGKSKNERQKTIDKIIDNYEEEELDGG